MTYNVFGGTLNLAQFNSIQISIRMGCSTAVQGSREEWMHVFFICSGFHVFSTIVYAVLASGVEQPWAKSTDAEAAESHKLTTRI